MYIYLLFSLFVFVFAQSCHQIKGNTILKSLKFELFKVLKICATFITLLLVAWRQLWSRMISGRSLGKPSKQMVLLLQFHHLGVDSFFEVQWCVLQILVSSPVLHWTVKWLKRCGNDFVCGVPISFYPFGFQVLLYIYIAVRSNTATLAVALLRL